MNQENFLLWLKRTEIPLSKISKKTGVSRSTLYKWMEGGPIRKRNMEKVVKIYQKEIEFYDDTITINKEDNVKRDAETLINRYEQSLDDKNFIINHQKEEINDLKDENKLLKDGALLNPIPKLYQDVQPDFRTTVKLRNILSFKSMERCIMNIDHPEIIANALKMDKNDLINNYFEVGKWANSSNHSVNKIINDKSLEELQSVSKQIPQQHKLYKFTFSAFYMRFFVMYEHKNNTLITQSICKINWSTQPIVETKNVVFKS
jgi:transcriptional regulator with XRE-family HTH domain